MRPKWAMILRARRRNHGMTQKALADAVGCDEHMVWKWEKGWHKPSPYYRDNLCECLCMAEEVFDG